MRSHAGDNTGDKFSFIAAGTTLDTVTTGGTWATYSTTFTAATDHHGDPSPVGGIDSGFAPLANDGAGGLVDNVQVQELNVTPTARLRPVEDTQATSPASTSPRMERARSPSRSAPRRAC